MNIAGCDYSFTHPTPAALKDARIRFVGRYLSDDPSKNITKQEAEELHALGINIILIWETTASRATEGLEAGVADASAAIDQAAALGIPLDTYKIPAGVPIYFAVDEDTSWESVAPYFEGVQSVLPTSQMGVYGDYTICEAARAAIGIKYAWQTKAWSAGRIDPGAQIQQGDTTKVGGVQVDTDTAIVADFGQWPPAAPAPKPPIEPEAAAEYRAKEGDSWGSIADPHGLSAEELFDYNTTPGHGHSEEAIEELKAQGIGMLHAGDLVFIP